MNNIYLNGVRIAALNEGGGTAYYLTDQVDSVSTVLDEDGKTLSRIQYQPYGETFVHKGDTDFSPKYNSQELDKETNFYFYNARYYDPAIARFTSADTVIDGQWDTQGWNRYSYVKGNPIRYKDPTGHSGRAKLPDPVPQSKNEGKGELKDTPAQRTPQGQVGNENEPKKGTDNTGIAIGRGVSSKDNNYNEVSKLIHLGLDILGFIPGAGVIFDGINTAYYAAEVLLGVGEATWGDVAMSGIAMIPGIGDAAAGAKIGRKIAKEALEHVDDAGKVAEGLRKGGKPHKHHSCPKFLCGENDHTIEIPEQMHKDLHRDLNDFLEKKTDDLGESMRPKRGNSGQDIRERFSPQERYDAIRDFYEENKNKYPEVHEHFQKLEPGTIK